MANLVKVGGFASDPPQGLLEEAWTGAWALIGSGSRRPHILRRFMPLLVVFLPHDSLSQLGGGSQPRLPRAPPHRYWPKAALGYSSEAHGCEGEEQARPWHHGICSELLGAGHPRLGGLSMGALEERHSGLVQQTAISSSATIGTTTKSVPRHCCIHRGLGSGCDVLSTAGQRLYGLGATTPCRNLAATSTTTSTAGTAR